MWRDRGAVVSLRAHRGRGCEAPRLRAAGEVAMNVQPGSLFPPTRSPSSILVVDDNDDLRDMLEAFLEREGFEVVTASDGPEALGALERGLDPGFILLDVMMPGMSGFEVLARIRSKRVRADIPIAMMSGSHVVDAAPGTYFLQKPFDLGRLLQLVRRDDCNPAAAARRREGELLGEGA